MAILKRLCAILAFCCVWIHAEDPILMNTQARIIPKMMVMIRNGTPRMNPVTMAIVYDDHRRDIAQQFGAKVLQLYPNGISDMSLRISVMHLEDVLKSTNIDYVYAIRMDDDSVSKLAEWGIEKKVPTFSYEVSDLGSGILGSVSIERTTKIYINKSALKAGKFQCNDALIQISRLIE